MWNPYDFSGRKYIVAGATDGIGKATVARLAEQGAEICLLGRNEVKLREVAGSLVGSGHRMYVKDFQESGGYKELFDEIVSDGKKIDGVVYCAGVARILPIGQLNKNTMDASMTVNLYSFAEMVSMFSKKKYHGKASVVGVSSISSLYPQKCQSIYAGTKAAMNAMSASLAIELAEKEIRINTVMPASTNTNMMKDAIENKSEEQVRQLVGRQLLGLEEPEDIADIILFLLSDASRMITGRAIYADGGYINF